MTVFARCCCALVFAALGAGCSTVTGADDASVQEVQAAAYIPSGPPRVTLLTVVNNQTGSGGHSAIVVSASQQVIFDPAGSFLHPEVPRRDDVLYGISPAWEQGYVSAHARSTYHVVSQDIPVSAQDAERVLRAVQSAGPVAAAFCANVNSSILREIPGYEDIDVTFFPVKLMEQVEGRPGVVTERYYEDDAGDVLDGIPAVQL